MHLRVCIRGLASLGRETHRVYPMRQDCTIFIGLKVVARRVNAPSPVNRAQVLQIHRVDILADLNRLRNLIGAQLLRNNLMLVLATLDTRKYLLVVAWLMSGAILLSSRRVSFQRPIPSILVAIFLSDFRPSSSIGPLHPYPIGSTSLQRVSTERYATSL